MKTTDDARFANIHDVVDANIPAMHDEKRITRYLMLVRLRYTVKEFASCSQTTG
jgi:hypothetical protein